MSPAAPAQVKLARSKSAGSIPRSRARASLKRVSSVAVPQPAAAGRRAAAAAPPNRTQLARKQHQQQHLARSRSAGNVSRKQSRTRAYPTGVTAAVPSTRRASEHIKPMALLSDVGAPAPAPRRLGFFRKNAAPAPEAAVAPAPAPRRFGGLFSKKPMAAQPQPLPTTSIPSQPSQPTRKPIVRFADTPAAGGPQYASSRSTPRARGGSDAVVVYNARAGGGTAASAQARDRAQARARARARAMGAGGSMPRYGRGGYTSSGGRISRTVQYGAKGPNGMMIRRMAIGGSALVPMGRGGDGGGGVGGTSMEGRRVIVDGTNLTEDCTGPGEGPLILIEALRYYITHGVDVFIIIQSELCDEWEADLMEPGMDDVADGFASLRASNKMYLTPRKSNYRLFLLRAGVEFGADLVSNDSYMLEEIACMQEDPVEVEDYLQERLIPFMLIRGKFIPHPEHARLLNGIHSPVPPPPPPINGSGGNGLMLGGVAGGGMGASRGVMQLRMHRNSTAPAGARRTGAGLTPRYNARLAQRAANGYPTRRYSSAATPRRNVRYNAAASGAAPRFAHPAVRAAAHDPRLRI